MGDLNISVFHGESLSVLLALTVERSVVVALKFFFALFSVSIRFFYGVLVISRVYCKMIFVPLLFVCRCC